MIGAAHRRRGVGCQDFSLVRELRGPSGTSLQLLAVADGHGGQRYRYSATGSRLACEAAADAIIAAMKKTPLGDQTAWTRLLNHDLPIAIEEQWLQAIHRDWLRKPEAADQSFCPTVYGSTLGLVLLAPGWWGCSGVGDWDLVRVTGDGAELLSTENAQAGSREATASLCLAEAPVRWSERAQLRPVDRHDPPFALLISTDGVRKSCATDPDFLELCRQIVPLGDGQHLADGLAEISAGGSGDDLSIAVSCWRSGSRTSGRRAGTGALLAWPLALALATAGWWSWSQSDVRNQPGNLGSRRVRSALPIKSHAWFDGQEEQLLGNAKSKGVLMKLNKGPFSPLISGDIACQHKHRTADQAPWKGLVTWSEAMTLPPPDSCPALERVLADP